MNESFYKRWFAEFSDGINEIKPENRSSLLKHCAMRCVFFMSREA